MPRDCFIVTGPCGTDLGGAIGKLRNYLVRDQRIPAASIVKLEDYMVRVHLARYPHDSRRSYLMEPGGFRHLVDRPKEYLRQVWSEAVTRATQEASEDIGTLFLLLHAALYHNGSEELFSCVDANRLKVAAEEAGLEIRRVFTLIDDCYDSFSRLTGQGQVWTYPDPDQSEAFGVVADVVAKVGLLLEWRAAEVAWAEHLADYLNSDHFLVAVKHPISVLADLAYSSKRPIYISHPITAVRALLAGGDAAGASRIMKEINDLTSQLRASAVVVPFSPTSIDEFRIRTDTGTTFLPELGQRWDAGEIEDLLFVPPVASVADPLRPPDGPVGKGHPLLGAYSALLTVFARRIKSHINWRDRKLVEQSRGLVVYRPYYQGRMSFGVLEEVEHRNLLEDHGVLAPGESPCVVLSPREDSALWRPEYIVGQIRDEATREDGSELSPDEMERLKRDLRGDNGFLALLETDHLDGPFLKEAVERVVRIRFRGAPGFHGPLDGERRTALEAWTAEKWEELAQNTNESDWVGSKMQAHDRLVRDGMSVAEFVGLVAEVFAG